MAPKKKGGKKQADDWETDLGQVPDPIAAATQDVKTEEVQQDTVTNGDADGDVAPAGGLMAALRKNKAKRAKKGKPMDDFVEGEDPTGTSTPVGEVDFNEKAPVEATFDDEDAFGGTGKKAKGGKNVTEPKAPESVADDEDKDDGGGLKSKKEKEKERKEREKQRKKEQVWNGREHCPAFSLLISCSRQRRRSPLLPYLLPKPRLRSLLRPLKQLQSMIKTKEARRRKYPRIWQPFRSNKKP